jgi:hypothetical protein
MARVWRVCRYRGKTGSRYLKDSFVFYLCFLSYHGVTHYRLYDPGFLGEYEKLYSQCQEKSITLFIGSPLGINEKTMHYKVAHGLYVFIKSLTYSRWKFVIS